MRRLLRRTTGRTLPKIDISCALLARALPLMVSAMALTTGPSPASWAQTPAQQKVQAPQKAPAADANGISPQMTDGTVKGQYGDWQVVCKPPPTGAKSEVCALVQSVTAEDRNNVGLTVYFQKFSNGVRVLRVFAPVGILLPPGLGLKVDDVDIGHAPFLRCHTFACYAQVTVEDQLIDKLKSGKTAIFIIFQTEEAGIGIPISLAGFADALAALK